MKAKTTKVGGNDLKMSFCIISVLFLNFRWAHFSFNVNFIINLYMKKEIEELNKASLKF